VAKTPIVQNPPGLTGAGTVLDQCFQEKFLTTGKPTGRIFDGSKNLILDKSSLASVILDPVTRGIELSSGGTPNLLAAIGVSSASGRFDVSQASISELNPVSCVVPTYVPADDQVVHPSVLYFEQKFGGHSFWMVATPYSAADSQYENPSIFYSDNGKTWVAATTNPLVPYPGGSWYNSDPYLFMTQDGRLCIWWRVIAGTGTYQKYITSLDGVNWTAPVTVLTTVKATEDLMSPSLCWESENSQYRIFGTDNAIANNPLMTATIAGNLDGAWSARSACTYVLPTGVTSLWHADIRRTKIGQYIGLMQVGTAAGGAIYPIASADGVAFVFGPVLFNIPNAYKTGFCIDGNTWRVWLGNLADRDLKYATVDFSRDIKTSARSAFLAAGTTGTLPVISNYATWDSFNRADGAAGTTPTAGTAWTVESGGFAIATNAVTGSGEANNKMYVVMPTPDAEVCAKFAVRGQGNLILRRVDTYNFMRARLTTGNLCVLETIVGGSITNTFIQIWTSVDGDRMRARCKGGMVQLFVNEELALSIETDINGTGLGFGIQVSDTTAKLNDFLLAKA
jgi:hypothetical protein